MTAETREQMRTRWERESEAAIRLGIAYRGETNDQSSKG